MRSYGKIETGFWPNPRIRPLSDHAKLLLLYLFSNEHSTLIGTYRLPLSYAAYDLRWDAGKLATFLKELTAGGFVEHEAETDLVRLPGWFGHNKLDNASAAKGAVARALALPDGTIKAATLRALVEMECSHLEPLKIELRRTLKAIVSDQSETSPTPVPDQSDTKEQEQEPEPEQEQEQEQEPKPPPAPDASLQGKQDADEAVAVIALVDSVIAELWGSKRAWPQAGDIVTARRWLDAGADKRLIEGVVRAVLGKKHGRREKPPTALAYFDDAVADVLAKRSVGAPTGRDGTGRYVRQSTDADLAEALAEAAEHERRLAAKAG